MEGLSIRLRKYASDGSRIASVEEVLAPRYSLSEALRLVEGAVRGSYPILLLTAKGTTLPFDPGEWHAVAVFQD